jgi:hypothetical protein
MHRFCGANVRSLFSLENSYTVHRILEQQQPDFLFAIETWHHQEDTNKLINKEYRILLSQSDEQRGGGVAIIYKNDLIVAPLFPEFHSRNFLLARLSSRSGCPLILLAVYFSPDHSRKLEMIAHLVRVLEYLRSRYKSFGLIAFGDLNTDFAKNSQPSDCKRMLRMVQACGLKIHRDLDPNAATRYQGNARSYLDYFLTTGVKLSKVSVGEKVGSSDHCIVSCQSISLAPVRRRRMRIFSKKKAAELMEDLFKPKEDSGKDPELFKLGPIDFFREVSRRSQSHAIIREPRPMNYFKAIHLVETELTQPSPDWKRIRKAISSCKRTEFLALLDDAKSYKDENHLKEFHRIVQNIMKMRKQNSSVHELTDPKDPGRVIYEPDKLQRLLSDKYRLLFCSDSPREPFAIGEISPTSEEEIGECLEAVSQGKGLGTDCIPDIILQLPVPELREKLRQFIDTVFEIRMIPAPFNCARLHLLNKLKAGVPTLEDLRPIMITSPLIKLIEAIALKELKSKLEPSITAAQTGFISKLGTQVHILRLLGRIKDIQSSPRFVSGNWFAFFIDFKSAFDRVNHQELFEKLRLSGISDRTINILKLLYNSYGFSLMEGEPNKINSGVAQGSLVSPLLYDWYVNDLVSHLSKQLKPENVFAYADDMAFLCLGHSDIRAALAAIEGWCLKNGAQLNKKKCGIIPIRKREVAHDFGGEFEGIPIVPEYKYLGVPLDSALTLKHLVKLMKIKIKKFNRRIGLVLQQTVGAATKLNLWQAYARCHFEYFSPAMAICGQLYKFESLFTGSLKKALSLPQHLPNERLIRVVGIPTLTQIASNHVRRNWALISQRFGQGPGSLIDLAGRLNQYAEQYDSLKKFGDSPERNKIIQVLTDGRFRVDLRAVNYAMVSKELLGLATGVYLTLRYTDPTQGRVGTIKLCTNCHVPGTQQHFLDECLTNSESRDTLAQSVPQGFRVPLLESGCFSEFYEQIRGLEVLNGGGDITEEKFEPLLRAAVCASKAFVSTTLARDSTEKHKPEDC